MNVENINKLISHMESIEDREYSQRTYTHDCGTPACIAGHAAHLSPEKTFRMMNKALAGNDIGLVAERWLDVSSYHALIMFKPYPLGRYYVTKQDAINMLKNLIETGDVVWEKENEC